MKFKIIMLLLMAAGNASVQAQTPWGDHVTKKVLDAAMAEARDHAKQYLFNTAETNAQQKKFMADTAYIEAFTGIINEIDYSTQGYNAAYEERINKYEELMEKYYRFLTDTLQGKDKKALYLSQEAWKNSAHKEMDLIWLMTKEKYSGGGTVQGNKGRYLTGNLYQDRAIALYKYWQNEVP